jgi:hypothetical protein
VWRAVDRMSGRRVTTEFESANSCTNLRAHFVVGGSTLHAYVCDVSNSLVRLSCALVRRLLSCVESNRSESGSEFERGARANRQW